jgi:hypothetical protein
VCDWAGDQKWGMARILTQLMDSDPLFQMGQDKIIAVIAVGTPFKVEVLLREH